MDELEKRVKSHALELETCLQQIRLALRHYNSGKESGNPDESTRAVVALRDKVSQSDPDLVTPDLVTPRFSDRMNFPRYRKINSI